MQLAIKYNKGIRFLLVSKANDIDANVPTDGLVSTT